MHQDQISSCLKGLLNEFKRTQDMESFWNMLLSFIPSSSLILPFPYEENATKANTLTRVNVLLQ